MGVNWTQFLPAELHFASADSASQFQSTVNYAQRMQESNRDFRRSITRPSALPIAPASEFDTPAVTSVPASVAPWETLGRSISDWYVAYAVEHDRCVTEYQQRSTRRGCGWSEDDEKQALSNFLPPSLDGIVDGCRAVTECGEPFLMLAKMIVRELGPLDDQRRWNKLNEWGYADTHISRHGGTWQGVITIERYLDRDLKFLTVGKRPWPRWQRDTGRLTFDDRYLKTIKVAAAVNVAGILDEFERQCWPESIRLKGIRGERLYQALKRLNQGLKILRFRVAGNTIRWDLSV